MSQLETALPDLMALLPDLHPCSLVHTKVATLRELRLVSKEVGSLAVTAVTSCEVHLGEGGSFPDPQQLVKLMSAAQLQKLKVVVHVTSGPNSSTVDQQTLACKLQADCLLTGMGAAIQSVTTLTLAVEHQESSNITVPQSTHIACNNPAMQLILPSHDSASTVLSSLTLNQLTSSSAAVSTVSTSIPAASVIGMQCPDSLGIVVASVSASLAPAIPKLQKLCLEGCCWDAALFAFGASCPMLVTLDVQAPQVPVRAMHHLGRHLPNLTTVTVGSVDASAADEQHVQSYLERFLHECASCVHLSSLEINFKPCITIDCAPVAWRNLSASLSHLDIGCRVKSSVQFQTLLQRVPSLRLEDYPSHNLLKLLRTFPVLQSLVVKDQSYDTSMLLEYAQSDDDDPDSEDSAQEDHVDDGSGRILLQKRILEQKFYLECDCLVLTGMSTDIEDLLSWLPPFPEIWRVTVVHDTWDETSCDWLHNLARVFPNLLCLSLEGDDIVSGVPGMDMGLAKLLKACSGLASLFLCFWVSLTTDGLVQLCNSLPMLCELVYVECEGVDNAALVTMLPCIHIRVA